MLVVGSVSMIGQMKGVIFQYAQWHPTERKQAKGRILEGKEQTEL